MSVIQNYTITSPDIFYIRKLISNELVANPTGFLLASNNLSDVASATSSLTNILPTQTGNSGKVLTTNGTVASWQTPSSAPTTFDDSLFAIYDNSDNSKIANFQVSTIGTGTTRTFTFPNTSGTIALTADLTGYLQSSNNLSDLANAATARTNLGLGSSATHPTSDFLVVSNNLSDLGSASTARTNLGLGTLATQSGTFSGTSSGTNTGDQTITLTGDVTGSGTGSFAATIANSAVTLAKITNIADQTILGNNSGGSAAPIALTATQTKTVLSLNNVENTALSIWAGSTNITTLGTIGTGIWHGTLIGGTYGGTGVNNGSFTITLGGSLTTSGSFGTTLTVTNTTNVTLPTTGTLVNWSNALAITSLRI